LSLVNLSFRLVHIISIRQFLKHHERTLTLQQSTITNKPQDIMDPSQQQNMGGMGVGNQQPMAGNTAGAQKEDYGDKGKPSAS
jgi:hypothetical protein